MKTQVDCITTTVILTVLVLLLGVAVDATQPKVTVGAVVTINVDLNEISQGQADNISVAAKRTMFTKTKTLVTINQDLYLKTTYRRYFIVDSISTEIYERLQSLNTVHSRTANYSKVDALDEIRNSFKSLTDQLFYNENHQYEINTSPDGESLRLARLLVEHPTTGYTPLDVPVTGVYYIYRHLLNCKHLPHKCAEYVAQPQ